MKTEDAREPDPQAEPEAWLPAPPKRLKGRGAASNPVGRFESVDTESFDDGWYRDEEDEVPKPTTQVMIERARSIIATNDSPDIGFDRSINPYRGCEHGCVYCFARPSHAYLNLSPGIDFETKLFAKTNAAEVLREELAKPGYAPKPIAFGTNTDPYQPIEGQYRIMRSVIEVLGACGHPFTIVTKNARIERDLDLLGPLAKRGLVRAFLSVTSLDNQLSSRLEPRCSAPHRRIQAIRRLTDAGVEVGVMVAPIIPMITDMECESILEQCRAAGAVRAHYVLLRLPWEVKDLFREWLEIHFPERAKHVMSLVNQMRGGKDYDARWGTRMSGEGVFAQLIARRFKLACERLGFNQHGRGQLDVSQFVAPRKASPQADLFG